MHKCLTVVQIWESIGGAQPVVHTLKEAGVPLHTAASQPSNHISSNAGSLEARREHFPLQAESHNKNQLDDVALLGTTNADESRRGAGTELKKGK